MDVFMKPNNLTAEQAVKQHLMASPSALGTEGAEIMCLSLSV